MNDSLFMQFIYQLFLIFLSIFSIGFIISVFNKIMYRLAGSKTPFVCHLTGLIGTPIHETGHAIFCFIFGHQIKEMKLYQRNKQAMGYVKHSYNPKSFYNKIGCFFIGIGPLILGMLIFIICMRLMLSSIYFDIISLLKNNESGLFTANINSIIPILKVFFSLDNFINIYFWIFIVLMCTIGLHMKLSKADIDNSKVGILFFILTIFIIDLILFIIMKNLMLSFTRNIEVVSFFVLTFLILMSCCFIILIILIYTMKKIVSIFSN